MLSSATLSSISLTYGGATQIHPFLREDARRNVDMRGWVAHALQWREAQKQQGRLRREQEQQHPVDTIRPS